MPDAGYYRARRLSRVAGFVFAVFAGLFLFWTIPWLPGGLDASDYTPKLAFTSYLLGGVAAAGACSLLLRGLALRHQESLVARTSLVDEVGAVRSGTFFYDRLTLECARALRYESTFSVLSIDVFLHTSEFEQFASLRDGALHLATQLATDVAGVSVVAPLGKDELGVLALDVVAEDRERLAGELRQMLAAELETRLRLRGAVDVRVGASTYGVEGRESMDLMGAARKAARRSAGRDTEAA